MGLLQSDIISCFCTLNSFHSIWVDKASLNFSSGTEQSTEASYCFISGINDCISTFADILTCDMYRLGNRCLRVSVFGSKSCVFLAVCGQIWQKFVGTYDFRSSSKYTQFLLIWSTESWEKQQLKGKKCQPQLKGRTLVTAQRECAAEACTRIRASILFPWAILSS